MSAEQFLSAFEKVFHRIQETQVDKICQAASWVAEAIMSDRFAVLFGSGHSFIPTMDVYPRIGSFPGWLPINELSTSYIARTSGDVGLRQSLFLEKVEGFGKVVLANYNLKSPDVLIAISNSGANTMAIEIALEAKKMGLKTIGISSINQSSISTSYHSSGLRLFEAVDLAIDNCVPAGDALVEVPGFEFRLGSASTIAGCIIMQSIATETARIFSSRGFSLPVFPSHNSKTSKAEEQKMEETIEKWFAEDARRARSIIR